MGQVTLYVDDETSAIIESAAKSARMSKSKWVASVIRDQVSAEWPEEIQELAGAWADFPVAEELRGGLGQDSRRI